MCGAAVAGTDLQPVATEAPWRAASLHPGPRTGRKVFDNFLQVNMCHEEVRKCFIRLYGVTVSTWDSESHDPGSNPGTTFVYAPQVSIFILRASVLRIARIASLCLCSVCPIGSPG